LNRLARGDFQESHHIIPANLGGAAPRLLPGVYNDARSIPWGRRAWRLVRVRNRASPGILTAANLVNALGATTSICRGDARSRTSCCAKGDNPFNAGQFKSYRPLQRRVRVRQDALPADHSPDGKPFLLPGSPYPNRSIVPPCNFRLGPLVNGKSEANAIICRVRCCFAELLAPNAQAIGNLGRPTMPMRVLDSKREGPP